MRAPRCHFLALYHFRSIDGLPNRLECAQDIPFGSVNAVYIVRTVASNGGSIGSSGLGFFPVMLCILLGSVASLVYKLVSLGSMPQVLCTLECVAASCTLATVIGLDTVQVWSQQHKLIVRNEAIAERARRLQTMESGQEGSSESDDEAIALS